MDGTLTMADKSFEMTLSGVNRLKEELDLRKVTTRQEVAERIKIALSFGDLSENSEYDDAKQVQAENEARIAEIEDLLKNVKVIDEEDISTSTVSVGSSVTLKDEATGETVVYLLVSPQEEDVLENKISTASPMGQAISGKKKGAAITVHAPGGTTKYKLTKIGKPKS